MARLGKIVFTNPSILKFVTESGRETNFRLHDFGRESKFKTILITFYVEAYSLTLLPLTTFDEA